MTTILEALKGISAYPVPLRTLFEIAEARELPLSNEATGDVLSGGAYNLSKADVLMWLSIAPDVSQGGQTYSFTDEQRLQMRNRARGLYKAYGGEKETAARTPYGYKGSRL